jgi:hypothetical protein
VAIGMSTLSTRDTEARFRLMAARGNPKRGLAILDRLDTADARKGSGTSP